MYRWMWLPLIWLPKAELTAISSFLEEIHPRRSPGLLRYIENLLPKLDLAAQANSVTEKDGKKCWNLKSLKSKTVNKNLMNIFICILKTSSASCWKYFHFLLPWKQAVAKKKLEGKNDQERVFPPTVFTIWKDYSQVLFIIAIRHRLNSYYEVILIFSVSKYKRKGHPLNAKKKSPTNYIYAK